MQKLYIRQPYRIRVTWVAWLLPDLLQNSRCQFILWCSWLRHVDGTRHYHLKQPDEELVDRCKSLHMVWSSIPIAVWIADVRSSELRVAQPVSTALENRKRGE